LTALLLIPAQGDYQTWLIQRLARPIPHLQFYDGDNKELNDLSREARQHGEEEHQGQHNEQEAYVGKEQEWRGFFL
jgi:hypothetical protein